MARHGARMDDFDTQPVVTEDAYDYSKREIKVV
jgi:hypothetical protein